jgi:CDP-paratose 2-epimerase
MKYKNILVTGGAGFVGSNICIKFKQLFPDLTITAFDNLYRKGSELNLPRLQKSGIIFTKGDVRIRSELDLFKTDLIIECSAEPSVLAGINSSPEYLLDTNLGGAINCFELARKSKADVIFLSTSRIYPIDKLNNISTNENDSRFEISSDQKNLGITEKGISENFSLEGYRSLYGATKLAAEMLLTEYSHAYGVKCVINRCGVIAGPWQFGKSDQGIITYWLASHIFNHPLKYINFGGKGKQVRDILHIDDLIDLLLLQIDRLNDINGDIYNVGGGKDNSVSLFELTKLCEKLTKNKLTIESDNTLRLNDVMIYITNNEKVNKKFKWYPKRNIETICLDIYNWMVENQNDMRILFNQS